MATSRKTYLEAARIVGRTHKAHGPHIGRVVESAFVALFITDNDRFDPKKFMDACEKETKA